MAVVSAQPKNLGQAAAAIVDDRVKGGAESRLVLRVDDGQPGLGRAVEGTAVKAENVLGFAGGKDLVAGDVPIPDEIAGAGKGKRAPFDIVDPGIADRPAGKGMLHDRKAEQEHNQDEPADKRRLHKVVCQPAADRQSGRHDPAQEQKPCRDQHDRPVVAARGKQQDDAQTCHADDEQQDPGDSGGKRRIG